jgi:hypothetical protein
MDALQRPAMVSTDIALPRSECRNPGLRPSEGDR